MRLYNPIGILNITILISTLILTACFGGSTSIPDDHYYRLPELVAIKMTTPLLNGTLSVKRVITYGIYGERTLIYTDENNRNKLNRYHYHHWEKSPSKLIQDNIVQYLKSSGIAQNVISYSQNTHADYLLEAELISMHRDITSKDYMADITINIQIYNKSNGAIYINKRYRSKITANSNELVSTIDAFGLSLKTIYDKLITDLQNMNIKTTTQDVVQ